MSDVRLVAARQYHRAAVTSDADAERHRHFRDVIVRTVRDEDPVFWTHRRLAEAVGVSEELIGKILRKAAT